MRTEEPSRPAKDTYLGWSEASNRFGWSSYVGDADEVLVAPALFDQLTDLAPAWVGVGTLDLFHYEDLAYAQRLERAGVPCHVEVVPGAFHGFDIAAPKSTVARAFFDSQCASLQRAFDAGQ